jgi:hypothetical protein
LIGRNAVSRSIGTASDSVVSAARQTIVPDAETHQRTRSESSHQNTASNGTTIAAAKATAQRKLGKIVSRKEVVLRSISITSMKFAVMIRTSCLKRDSRIRITIRISEIDAETVGRRSGRSRMKFSSPQASKKVTRPTKSVSVQNSRPSAARCSSPSAPSVKRWRSPRRAADQVRLR